jgi:hypothetical protein
MHLNLKAPPRICVPTTPNISIMKQNNTKISIINGSELRIVVIKVLIPGIELIVFKGLKILITLKELIFEPENKLLIHPKKMTVKSSTFQGSLK